MSLLSAIAAFLFFTCLAFPPLAFFVLVGLALASALAVVFLLLRELARLIATARLADAAGFIISLLMTLAIQAALKTWFWPHVFGPPPPVHPSPETDVWIGIIACSLILAFVIFCFARAIWGFWRAIANRRTPAEPSRNSSRSPTARPAARPALFGVVVQLKDRK
jgi:hypothetical protein